MVETVRSLWQSAVPLGMRQSIGKLLQPMAVEATLVRARSGLQSVGRGAPVLVGFFSGASGIAQSVQLASRALDHLGLPHIKADVGDLRDPNSAPESSSSAWLYHLNPPELLSLWRTWDVSNLSGPRFGYWAWELAKAPHLWRRTAKVVNGVMVPSRYAAEAMGHGDHPVCVVPHPMFAQDFASISRRIERLPGETFRAVALFDFKSSVARKNPFAILQAFEAAFGGDKSARLFLKTHNSDFSPELATALRAAAGRNVEIMDGVWDRERVLSFIAGADVLISLPRAEGFGLTLAEAMMLGTPVVATGWSGNLDFMDSDCASLVPSTLKRVDDAQGIYRGQTWAEPDVSVAAAYLRRLKGDPEYGLSLAVRARERVVSALCPDAWFRTLPAEFRQAFALAPSADAS